MTTLVPGAQYFSGRKSSRLVPNQWPFTAVPSLASKVMPWTTASLFLTSLLKTTETIMPTP